MKTQRSSSSFGAALAALLLASLSPRLCGATTIRPTVPAAEAVVIEEVQRMAAEVGDEIWPGLAGVPFPIVLVSKYADFLIGWDEPAPEGFHPYDDPRLGTVLERDRVFARDSAAAFPAFGPPAVVVIGTMRATGLSPGEWALTLLHEHFHQLQYAAEGYYSDVERLDLAGDDTSGMWMLEYPFPYGDELIGTLFADLAAALALALEKPRVERLTAGAGAVDREDPWRAFDALSSALDPADARYLSFQLWQEGVARFVEARAAEVLAAEFEPGAAFLELGDFDGWASHAEAQRRRIVEGLEATALAEQRRVSLYPVGAALAMLHERHDSAWKSRYEAPRFALEGYGRTRAEPGVEITYLANEGFLLAAGDDKVLIDALFPGIDGYPRVPPELRRKLARGEAPFDGVDLVLATHFHGDHFGAVEVARHLESSGAVFVSTPDAVTLLKKELDGAFDAVAQHPGEGTRSSLTVGEDLRVTILNLHHGRDRPRVQNLGFVVEIGGLEILHVGDTEVNVRDLEPYDLGNAGIDVALLPGWLYAEPSWRPVVKAIGARQLVVMHLAEPGAPPSWFGSAGSLEGRIALIREHFPGVWVPIEALASRRYEPASHGATGD